MAARADDNRRLSPIDLHSTTALTVKHPHWLSSRSNTSVLSSSPMTTGGSMLSIL
jgi:hypothetical protein